MNCNVCRRDLSLGEGKPYLNGLSLRVDTDGVSEEGDEALEEMVKPYSVNKEYNVCYPCWLRSLGIPPDNPPEEKPRKVYVVIDTSYWEGGLEGIWSSRAGAEEYLQSRGEGYEVKEYLFDVPNEQEEA